MAKFWVMDLSSQFLVNEIFYSLQGEGSRVGEPSVFVRLAGCNLRCRWCDTPKASWNPQGESLSLRALLSRLHEWPKAPVVITGGEPLLAEFLPNLCDALRNEQRFVSVESAATIYRPLNVNLITLSPKLSNSDPEGAYCSNHRQLRRDITALISFLQNDTPCILKFVAQDSPDIQEIAELMGELALAVKNTVLPTVYIMPQARSAEELLERSRMLAPLCLARGWILGDRMHIRLWGNRPGV